MEILYVAVQTGQEIHPQVGEEDTAETDKVN